MATRMRLGFDGSITTVWRHKPPPPGCHCARCSCACSPSTRLQLSPASRDSKSAAGSTPAYRRFGSSGGPQRICHTCVRARSVSAGNRMFWRSGADHVAPRSSLDRITLPQWKLRVPARIRWRPPRWSSVMAYTDSPLKCGPSMRHSRRAESDQQRKAPLAVPTRTTTSPSRPGVAAWGIRGLRRRGSVGEDAALRLAATRGELDADVLVPEVRPGGDELPHQPDAALIVQNDEVHSALAKIRLRAGKGRVFARDHARDAIKQHRAAAHVAWRQGRVQRRAPIVRRAQSPCVLQAVHLGVKHRTATLDTPVVSPGDYGSVDDEDRSDWNAAFREPEPSFVDRRVEEGIHAGRVRPGASAGNRTPPHRVQFIPPRDASRGEPSMRCRMAPRRASGSSGASASTRARWTSAGNLSTRPSSIAKRAASTYAFAAASISPTAAARSAVRSIITRAVAKSFAASYNQAAIRSCATA